MTPEGEHALHEQLSQAREKLEELVRALNAIDREMDDLEPERRKYRLLGDVCGGLEELDQLGAAALFWGERVVNGEIRDQLRLARGRLDAFDKRLDEIGERRQAVVLEIEQAQENTELIEDDLLEAERAAEQRRMEWIVEREDAVFPAPAGVMPWSRGGEDDRRFRKTLALALLIALLLGLLLPLVKLPLPEAWAPTEVPERLTRLIREERPLPPQPPAPVKEQKKLQKESEPELAKKSSPTEQQQPTAKATPSKSVASKGILAFREKFSSLSHDEPAARLGSQARIRHPGEAAVGRAQRSLVATQGAGSSGGIDVGALSRDFGGGGDAEIGGVQVARVTSSIAGSGSGSDRPLSGDGPGLGRTDEEIQIVFDRHKAALYRLYNRELRRDPTLQGQMVLRIRIEPDGSVSLCELQSTDMKAPELAAQVLERVRTFDFGAKEGVSAITIVYPIDFLPAT